MQSGIRVATPPPKPLMVYDGDCNFCTLWVRRWQQMTGDSVDYLPAQDPQWPPDSPKFRANNSKPPSNSSKPMAGLFRRGSGLSRAGHNPNAMAVAQFTKIRLPSPKSLNGLIVVAENRSFFSRLTRWFWGRHVEQPTQFLTRWVFLRALGLIYLIAFVSLWTQISGLIGHNGILPTDQFMTAAQQQGDLQGIGLDRFHLLPTLCWFNSSDGFLDFQCAAGAVLAVLLIIGIAPAPCLILLWLLYLSLVTVGGIFWLPMGQPAARSRLSGHLLCAVAILAALERAWSAATSSLLIFHLQQLWQRGLPPLSSRAPPSRIVLWLLRLLLFKLMFSSGCVKLLSGDPNWRNLTALTFHYQTQPLPTWIGWYANQLPLWFQKLSCAVMFAIELGAPFLIFAPRRLRFFGGAAIAFLQTLILLTGNYTFFNLLTLALCLLLLDDFALQTLRRPNFPALVSSQPINSPACHPVPLSRRWPLHHRPARQRRPRHFTLSNSPHVRRPTGLVVSGGGCGRVAGAVPHLQQLRPVCGDDHRAA